MDRITIIGSSNIGLSMGLRLKELGLKETEVVGTSGDRMWRGKAAEAGAFDSVGHNLGTALEGAKLVIFDTAPADTLQLMEAVGPVLERDCSATDTGSAMVQSLEAASTHLRADTTFVAGRPLLRRPTDDLDAADGNAFDGADYCLAPSPHARADGIKPIVGLVEALGATPLFIDPREHDSYAAAVTIMPSLLSSALMATVANSSSWREMSKLVGGEFREMSKLAHVDPVETAAAVGSAPEHVARWIGQMIETLASYQELAQGPTDQLEDALIEAWEEWIKLEMGAVTEDDRPRTPSAGETVAGMFVGRRLAGRAMDISEANKNAAWRYRKARKKTDR